MVKLIISDVQYCPGTLDERQFYHKNVEKICKKLKNKNPSWIYLNKEYEDIVLDSLDNNTIIVEADMLGYSPSRIHTFIVYFIAQCRHRNLEIILVGPLPRYIDKRIMWNVDSISFWPDSTEWIFKR
jgi:hypothetical protein